MRPKRRGDLDTRQRLLDVATRQFAERGYRHVTIRAISHEARANVAAVNYHFRDKLTLYGEVLEAAFAVLSETTALAMREGHGLGAEERLRAYIRVHCERIFAVRGPSAIQQLIQREINEPTIELSRFVERVMKPRFDYIAGAVGELLGLPAGDARVRLCAFSIHGLVIMFRPSPAAARIGAILKVNFSIEQVSGHLTEFCLAGLEAYRPAPASRARPGRHRRRLRATPSAKRPSIRGGR